MEKPNDFEKNDFEYGRGAISNTILYFVFTHVAMAKQGKSKYNSNSLFALW